MNTIPTSILVLVAGTNQPSNADTLANHFIEGMKTIEGVSFEKLQVRELSLDHFSLDCYDDETKCEPDYLKLRTLITGASGIVIATPVWNFSVPAHLKNLIDRIGAFGLDAATHSKGQFNGKPVALIYTGGAPMIAWKALMYLTTLHVAEAFKYYGSTIIYRHFEPKCVEGRGKFGLVVDKRPAALEQIKRDGKRFAEIAQTFQKNGLLPAAHTFWRRWFEFLYRVGNRLMYPLSERQ